MVVFPVPGFPGEDQMQRHGLIREPVLGSKLSHSQEIGQGQHIGLYVVEPHQPHEIGLNFFNRFGWLTRRFDWHRGVRSATGLLGLETLAVLIGDRLQVKSDSLGYAAPFLAAIFT